MHPNDEKLLEYIKLYSNRFLSKLNKPWFVALNLALLWFALIITNYTTDVRFWEVQDFLNENCPKWQPMVFEVDLNATKPDVNITDIPRMKYGS